MATDRDAPEVYAPQKLRANEESVEICLPQLNSAAASVPALEDSTCVRPRGGVDESCTTPVVDDARLERQVDGEVDDCLRVDDDVVRFNVRGVIVATSRSTIGARAQSFENLSFLTP